MFSLSFSFYLHFFLSLGLETRERSEILENPFHWCNICARRQVKIHKDRRVSLRTNIKRTDTQIWLRIRCRMCVCACVFGCGKTGSQRQGNSKVIEAQKSSINISNNVCWPRWHWVLGSWDLGSRDPGLSNDALAAPLILPPAGCAVCVCECVWHNLVRVRVQQLNKNSTEHIIFEIRTTP